MLDKTSDTQARPFDFGPLLPVGLGGAQERGTELSSRTGEILAKTAKALWENQVDMMRLETLQTMSGLAVRMLGKEPGPTMAACCDQWHQNNEQLIAHMRTASDLVRECGWQLFDTYLNSLRRPMK
ncbi:MAG TPA: hypothetical protein VM689_22960 [Aliidongia sp.]|nr:hypothetical protein [Aliidongia sp.]